jgi:hypothetical protein
MPSRRALSRIHVGSQLRAQLSADISKLEALVPANSVHGERYQTAPMAHLDSEE